VKHFVIVNLMVRMVFRRQSRKIYLIARVLSQVASGDEVAFRVKCNDSQFLHDTRRASYDEDRSF
jgi:hypothetical protein